jgi:alpha-aminoadipic semialdehyde synthase
MGQCIGIRREDKNRWERRAPLVPADLKKLVQENGIRFRVQPSPIRALSDEEFADAGAEVAEDLSSCPVVIAVKEIPTRLLLEQRTYIFFSHTIKGQDYNMAMLRRLMELKCNLIDYERIIDDNGRRLIFFGRFAGVAGMIETLAAFGRRLRWEGTPNVFEAVEQPYRYGTLEEAKQAVTQVGEAIRRGGLPPAVTPMVCGFTGYGNVSQGAQEICDLLPVRAITPAQLLAGEWEGMGDSRTLWKVEFHEQDMARPVDRTAEFILQEYYDHPDRYVSAFGQYLPLMTLMVNCIYWTEDYPRLATRQQLLDLFGSGRAPKLRVIGDISCDIDGAIECTVKPTEPGNPVYVYDPVTGKATDGVEGSGPVVMPVDNLPCELPLNSSEEFSTALSPFIPGIAAADFSGPLEACDLPAPVKRALLLYQGELTPDYEYMKDYLK